MATKTKNNTGFRNGKLFCFNCGGDYAISYPQPVSMATALMEQFVKDHKDCEPTWKAPEPDLTTPYEERVMWWVKNGEHGTSSKTMWCVLSDYFVDLLSKKYELEDIKEVVVAPSGYSHPQDPDDFRRCYLLLKAIPEWRERISDMKKVSTEWHNLACNWDKLTEMFEQKSTDMYEFMQSLNKK